MKKLFVVEFHCHFDMRRYPFDTQDCSAELGVANGGDYLELFGDTMEYTGDRAVMKYVISNLNGYKENGRLIFKFSFGRELMSVILTTMLPTSIIVLIALSTNYYVEVHFKTVIPVNLMCLLLFVNLYIGLSGRLPETSYLKMIDVWLVASLTVPFTNVLLHGYLDHLRKKLKKLKGIEYNLFVTLTFLKQDSYLTLCIHFSKNLLEMFRHGFPCSQLMDQMSIQIPQMMISCLSTK